MAARATKLQPGKGGKLVSKKSKTNDPACSQAMSTWKTSGMTPDVAATLARCRSMAANKKKATLQREAGNEGKAQVLEKRAERGLTGKDRIAKAKELIAQRKAKIDTQVAAKATTAKPSLREQADAARAAKGGPAERAEAITRRAESIESRLRERYKRATNSSKPLLRQRLENAGRAAASPGVVLYKNKIASKGERTEAYQSLAAQADIGGGQLKTIRFKSASSPAPSPRDQAAAARTAKGDRSTRLKALADKAMAIAERRATKANSLTGAAQDRMLDRSMASAERYNRLEAARTPFVPASKAKATPSLREQAAAARAKKGDVVQRARALRDRNESIASNRVKGMWAKQGMRSNVAIDREVGKLIEAKAARENRLNAVIAAPKKTRTSEVIAKARAANAGRVAQRQTGTQFGNRVVAKATKLQKQVIADMSGNATVSDRTRRVQKALSKAYGTYGNLKAAVDKRLSIR